MTAKHDPEKYKDLKKVFDDNVKKILNYETRSLPAEKAELEVRVEEYKIDLINSYNDLVSYVDSIYASVDPTSKNRLKESVSNRKLRLLRALLVLSLTTDLPEGFTQIEFENLVQKDALAGGTDNSQIFVNLNSANVNNQNENSPSVASSRRSSVESVSQLNSNPNQDNNLNTAATEDTTDTDNMTLSLSDILNGIPDFSSKNYDDIKHFIAKADLIHALATTQQETVLSVIRAELVTANKLGNVSTSSWADIKKNINDKYRVSMSFETAQERLLSIKQSPKESLDEFANRVKSLLDALNAASYNANADVQTANQAMNENLAVRKFKQNIFDEKIRIMALSNSHSTLADAIAHATEKKEQLQSSNVTRDLPKTENKGEQNNKNGNNFNGKSNNGNNKKNNGKKREPCVHCGLDNHTSDRCYRKKKEEAAAKNENKAEKFANRARASKSMNVAAGAEEEITEAPANGMQLNQASAQNQTVQLRPYPYLNF